MIPLYEWPKAYATSLIAEGIETFRPPKQKDDDCLGCMMLVLMLAQQDTPRPKAKKGVRKNAT